MAIKPIPQQFARTDQIYTLVRILTAEDARELNSYGRLCAEDDPPDFKEGDVELMHSWRTACWSKERFEKEFVEVKVVRKKVMR